MLALECPRVRALKAFCYKQYPNRANTNCCIPEGQTDWFNFSRKATLWRWEERRKPLHSVFSWRLIKSKPLKRFAPNLRQVCSSNLGETLWRRFSGFFSKSAPKKGVVQKVYVCVCMEATHRTTSAWSHGHNRTAVEGYHQTRDASKKWKLPRSFSQLTLFFLRAGFVFHCVPLGSAPLD